MPGRLATAFAIAFPGGARHEAAGETGVAHLLEHMAFKGAEEHRTARALNRASEHLGTDMNAVTCDEYVEFSAVVRAESAMATLDLLTDLAGRPLLEQDHLETERAVILQEIADDDEDPASAANRRVNAALFGDHRLAVSTAGERRHVERLTHAQVVSFRARQWSPEAGVAVVAGNFGGVERDRMRELLMRLPACPPPRPTPPLPPFERRVEIEERDGDVAHLRLAYAVPGLQLRHARDRAVAEVYSDVLGGLAGSRLFEELREQRGLCYAIDGDVWGYREAAFLSVECSLLAANIDEAYRRIDAIVTELSEHGAKDEEVQRARSYAVGTSALGFESTTARTGHAVDLIMDYGDHAVDAQCDLDALESVTAADVAELAARVVPGPCVGCAGPVSASTFMP
jgi:predicted Zn-dependent peptidase